jgi:hypothetical protein
MENCNLIIILGSFHKNTFEIVRPILEFLELDGLVHVPQSESLSQDFNNLVKNLAIKFFDWNNFTDLFENESDSEEQEVVVMLSPKFNLAEQFQQLFDIHGHFSLNVKKIISIIDGHYFDGYHENLLDAMAYFADILLIDNNPEINHNRLKKFLEHCKQKECYPLPIRILSQYSVKNIPELLDDQPRRMTLIFDDLHLIDFIDETMANSGPFIILTLAQRDKYLKKDDRGNYCLPIEW